MHFVFVFRKTPKATGNLVTFYGEQRSAESRLSRTGYLFSSTILIRFIDPA